MMKMCQRCREFADRDEFEIVPFNGGLRKSRVCNTCKQKREAYLASLPKQLRPDVIRKRELAMIPNPFVRGSHLFRPIANLESWEAL